MRVLHLPYNVASQIQITVNTLRELGIEARGIVTNHSLIHSSNGLEVYPYPGQSRLSLHWFKEHSIHYYWMFKAIQWADVVHYHFGGEYALPKGWDVTWACVLNKPRLITFWGSDIRIPEIDAKGNPYYAHTYEAPTFEYIGKSNYEKSYRVQQYYAKRGFACVLGAEIMIPHIQADLFPEYHLVRCFINTQEVKPCYLTASRKRGIVVHSPSAPIAKGTPSVIKAVKILQEERGIDFDLVLNQDKPREEALNLLKDADIFLDQFVLGGYGMAAIEAMAMGKPVVCYISPSSASLYPPDMPIINANQDNLADVLETLLSNGKLRRELGRRSRAYVEKYHDAKKNARQLVSIYECLLKGRMSRSSPSPFC